MSPARVKEIFLEALALPPEARTAFVIRVCGDDRSLREQVEDLLKTFEEAGRFMSPPVSLEATQLTMRDAHSRGAAEHQGTVIDRYKLLEQIGEGGFGTVWMAEQRVPVTRRVALKIIKLGMDTKQVIARFEAERQALAIMDHPNIARVFDAGATETGRPYFVMELVKGIPITQYCDSHNLSTHDRLQLFVSVCQAVQHAHTKGIIHRDIKPSNVLVSQHDEKPVAKVIDFGIAKATASRLTEKTVFTEFRQMIGTPAYMSPEQAGLSDLDIDTRTDVYSLGVLLYELLTGTTPFDVKTLLSAGYAEIQRIIREVEPPTPSTRLSTLKEDLPSVAANRRTEPARLRKLVQGDLDWIVMKCLEKDRTRRYETANGLAADVERYLAGDVVVAAPPSAGYRFRKFIRRNKAGVITGGLLVFVLFLGFIGTTYGMVWALKERSLARQAAAAEAVARGEARDRAAALERVSKFQAEQLSGIDVPLMGIRLRDSLIRRIRAESERSNVSPQEIDDRLNQVKQLFAGIDFTGMANETLNVNIFQRAIAAIGTEFADQPHVKAQLLQTVADALVGLGLLEQANAPQEEALKIRRTALGEDHPDSLSSMHASAVLRSQEGRYGEAKPLFSEVIEKRRRILGNDHPDTLTSIFAMGTLLYFQGQYAQAEPYFNEALDGRRRALGATHPDTLQSVRTQGLLRLAQGRLGEAETLGREAVESCRRTLGADHADTLTSMGALSSSLKWQRKYGEAEELDRGVWEGRRRLLGDDHPNTLIAMSSLGETLRNLRKLPDAEHVLREVMNRQRRLLGDDHPDTLVSISRVGMVLCDEGRYQEAEPYYREALEGRRRRLGNDHANTLASISNMGFLLQKMGRLSEAEADYREALEGSRRSRGPEHPGTLSALFYIGKLQFAQDKFTEAEATYHDVLQRRRRVLGDKHPETRDTMQALGLLLTKTGRYAEAEPVLLEAAAGLESETPNDRQSNAGQYLIDLYDAWDKVEPGQGHDAKAATWRARLNASTSRPAASRPMGGGP